MSKKRTLYSKAGFSVADVASRDKEMVALNRVHLDADGSTVASNGRAVLAVSPPNKSKMNAFPDMESDSAEPGPDGIGLCLEDVARLKRAFPNDKRPSLQYAQMTRCSSREVELMTTDGKSKQKVAGQPARGRFPAWRKILSSARKKANVTRFCVDRQALVKLLQAIDKACPDRGGYNPVYVEVGGPDDHVIFRAHNYDSAQTAIGLITTYRNELVSWLEDSNWEKEMCENQTEVKKVKKKKKARRLS